MRVAYFTGLRRIEIQEAPPPRLKNPQDVLVRIDRVGVCGSDVHYYENGRIGDQVLSYPATLGHECAGTIVAAGRSVGDLHEGDRVAIDPALICGECDQCRAGRINTCRRLQFLGCPNEAPGAVADYQVLPAENCVRVPDSVDQDVATLVEPLSIGLHALHLAEPRPDAKIAIFGVGPIGLSVLMCAKALGRCTVYATDLLDVRLQTARQCGADWTGDPKQTDVVKEVSGREPHGLDLVYECSGDPACIDYAQKLLGPGGTLVLVGIPAQNRVDFDVHVMRRKELTFKNVRRQRSCVAPVIDLIASGRLDPRPMITHHFPLDRITEAFELVAGYRDGVIKAMIELDAGRSGDFLANGSPAG